MNKDSQLPPINKKHSQNFRNKIQHQQIELQNSNQTLEIKSTLNEEGGISLHEEQSDDKSVQKPLLQKNQRASMNNSQLTIGKHSSVSSLKKISKGGAEISDSSIEADLSKSSKIMHSSTVDIHEEIVLPYHLRDHPLLTQENLRKYKQLFDSVDIDKGGAIDVTELNQMLEKVGVRMTDLELKEIMQEYDTNNTGTIDFLEFVQIFTKLLNQQQQSESESDEFNQDQISPEPQSSLFHSEINSPSKTRRRSRLNNPIVIDSSQLDVKKPRLVHVPGKDFINDFGLDWDRLNQYLDETHPRQTVEIEEKIGDQVKMKKVKRKFGCLCTNIGQLAFGKEARELTEVESQIGIGLTIYFRQLKLYMVLFTIFALAYIPILLVLFYTAQADNNLQNWIPSHMTQQKSSNTIFNLLQQYDIGYYLNFLNTQALYDLSLGSLGRSEFFCQSAYLIDLSDADDDYQQDIIDLGIVENIQEFGSTQSTQFPIITNFTITCSQGKIKNLVQLGLSTPGSRCPYKSLDDNKKQSELLEIISADEECSMRGLSPDSIQLQNIMKNFTFLKDLQIGNFSLEIQSMFSPYCVTKIQTILQALKQSNSDPNLLELYLNIQWKPEIYILVQCLSEELVNPLNGQRELNRQNMLILVGLTDCVIVFLFMISIIFVEKISERAVNEFRDFDNCLELRDFSIQVTNLPKIHDYRHEQVLKSLLITHFEKLARNEPQQIKSLAKIQKYDNQIVDVFFAKQDYGPMIELDKIKDLFQEISYLDCKAHNTNSNNDDTIMKLEQKIDSLQTKFIESQNEFYQESQNIEIYRNKLKRSCLRDDNIQMAFIIFRSMEGQARVLNAYKTSKCTWTKILRRVICCCCWSCIRKPEEVREDQLRAEIKFMNQFDLEVEKSSEPDKIQWTQFSTSKCSKFCQIIAEILRFIILVGVVTALFWFYKYYSDEYETLFPQMDQSSWGYGIGFQNSSQKDFTFLPKSRFVDSSQLTFVQSYGALFFEQNQVLRKREGIMQYFCYSKQKYQNLEPQFISTGSGTRNCVIINQYKLVLSLYQPVAVILLTILTAINIFTISCCSCRNHRTKLSEHQLLIWQGLVTAIAVSVFAMLLANWDFMYINYLLDFDFQGFIKQKIGINIPKFFFRNYEYYFPYFRGQYTEFTAEWHNFVGKIIVAIVTVFLILYNLGRIISHLWYKFCIGFNYLCCCFGGTINGQLKKTQEDLNNLYAGSQFDIVSSYIIMHLITWITMVFGQTLPLLFPLCFMFYFGKYWLDKYFVLTYYKKNRSFDENLPLSQIKYFKWSIFIHGLSSILLLSTNQFYYDSYINPQTFGLAQQQIAQLPLNLFPYANDENNYQKGYLDFQPQDQTVQSRLLQSHMIMLYLFYLVIILIYILQEKIEICLSAICSKCRGDEEYNDYDSEIEEEEVRHYETKCNKCEIDKLKKEERRKKIRKFLGEDYQFRDNNLFDDKKYEKAYNDEVLSVQKRNQLEKQKSDKIYKSSSEDEGSNQLGGIGVEKQSDLEEQRAQLQLQIGHYSDDFFQEISFDYLIFYSERNNFEMQKLIQTLTQSMYFDPRLVPFYASTYVGTEFKQIHMKQIVGLHKRRRNTFRRRILQLMNKMNPRIAAYFRNKNFEKSIMGVDIDPYDQQLTIFKQILQKKLDIYRLKEKNNDLNQALSLSSLSQKLVLQELQKKARIYQKHGEETIQSYEVLDQERWQGAMSVLSLYLPHIRSDWIAQTIGVVNLLKNQAIDQWQESQKVDKQQNLEIQKTDKLISIDSGSINDSSLQQSKQKILGSIQSKRSSISSVNNEEQKIQSSLKKEKSKTAKQKLSQGLQQFQQLQVGTEEKEEKKKNKKNLKVSIPKKQDFN